MSIELNGKYNSCVVYTDRYDNATVSQLIQLLNQPCTAGSKIRIMPDTHAGKGCVIGTTMTLSDKVIPNLVGVDIGCGVLVIKLKEKRIDLMNLDSIIHKYVPAGGNIHEEERAEKTGLRVDKLRCYSFAKIKEDVVYRSVGTLGGGNHFIEVDKDDDGNLYLVIHTGSRNLGVRVCEAYQSAGYEQLKDLENGGSLKDKLDALVKQLKAEGRHKEIATAMAKLKAEYKEKNPDVPYELAYVTGSLFEDYIHDMRLVQSYAADNRSEIARIIMKQAKLHEVERFDTIHNYIDTVNMILRKGSISAQAGEKVIIPINMRDGSLICMGKGNPEWNMSAPHGAGRLMSRSVAKETVSMDEFRESMQGIYTTSVNRSTIDESPMAYKPIDEIMQNIEPTVDILCVIKPIYNFKAGEED